jgi:TonB family protein
MRLPGLIASITIHAALVALLLLIRFSETISEHLPPPFAVVVDRIHAPRPRAAESGGGERSPLPARRGPLPEPVALRPFVQPMRILNQDPKLVLEQAILDAPDFNIQAAAIGDPLGVGRLPSGGPGGPTGIGGGAGGNIGPGPGSKFGSPGPRPKTQVTRRPQLIYQVEPEYSEEARKARYQGVVVLSIEVGLDGVATNIHVVQGAGLGLDERAIDAVRRWRFRPALAGDHPVVAPAVVEVSFRLL